MRYILMMTAVFALGLSVLTACQDAAPPVKIETAKAANSNSTANVAAQTDSHGHEDNAPRITLADAKKDFDAGNVVFVDTRAETAYKQEHIKGAINMPMEAFEAKYKGIPTGKKIIAYCS
jgi:hypothetical protein